MTSTPSTHASWAHGVRSAGERERNEAACRFAVHGVAKSGKPYRDSMSVHSTREAAETKRDYYASVNSPDRQFVVVER